MYTQIGEESTVDRGIVRRALWQNLKAVRANDYEVFDVDEDKVLSEFVSRVDNYQHGFGYYEIKRPENIPRNKSVMLMNKINVSTLKLNQVICLCSMLMIPHISYKEW